MADLMLLLLMISLGLLLIGFVKPQVSLFWSNQSRTRQKSVIIYIVLSIAFFICFGINLDSKEQNNIVSSTDTVVVAKVPDLNDPTIAGNLFDHPNAMVMALSKNGIGTLTPWNNRLDQGWGSSSKYYLFGTVNKAGMMSNISYNLEGTKFKVIKLTLLLNVNSVKGKKSALIKFAGLADSTLHTLQIEMPPKLKKAILSGKLYKQDVLFFNLSFQPIKTNIETFKLDIEPKHG